MTEDENSPENLRKFLESDDPAMVMMGLSMAKGSGEIEKTIEIVTELILEEKFSLETIDDIEDAFRIPIVRKIGKKFNEEHDETWLRNDLLRHRLAFMEILSKYGDDKTVDSAIYNLQSQVSSMLSLASWPVMEDMEIPKEIFPHLCILTFDLLAPGSNVGEEIRSRAEDLVYEYTDIPDYGGRDEEFWNLGNADLIVQQLEQTEGLWGWFRELPDENGYYDLNEVIEKFPWRSDAFSDGGERAEELLRGILNGDVVDLKRRWRKEIELDHGLILQANAEEALVKLGKIDPEDCIWHNEWKHQTRYDLFPVDNFEVK